MKIKKIVPTLFTLLRPVAVILLWFTIPSRPFASLLVFGLAALTDALDGFFARRWDVKTSYGAVLDPIADKIFYFGTLYLLKEHVPGINWVLIITFPTELALVAIRFYPLNRWLHVVSVAATEYGKIKTILQSSAVICILWGLAVNHHDTVMIGVGITVGAILLSWKSLQSHF